MPTTVKELTRHCKEADKEGGQSNPFCECFYHCKAITSRITSISYEITSEALLPHNDGLIFYSYNYLSTCGRVKTNNS
ncbi:MAG: hypothetical protein KatS3mg027_2422 [Bacteroidia bacterium]|nr:MAG: hypothetical protein KatS3mg027_2422 [Bacteroidia bacterium]